MTETSGRERSPNPIDRYVGARIRARRKVLGVSQEKLADHLGLTFQQVQKYERGTNRVSASKLYEIARSLKASISYFFEDLGDPATGLAQPGMAEGEATPFVRDSAPSLEVMEVARSIGEIKRPKVRRQIIALAKALAEEEAQA